MKVLAIDSSNFTMGVAISDGGTVIGEVITNLKKNHSLRLMPAISELMKEVGLQPSQIERIVVAHGPGSYTGVRIGVTVAKTLAWSLQIPIVGVSSLQVLAQNGRFFDGDICPIFDARRGQVYTGLYETKNHIVINKENDRLILLEDWLEQLKEKNNDILFLGNDLSIHRENIEMHLGRQAFFASESMQNPRPSELARLGLDALPHESVHTLVPQYLQLAEAEAKWIAEQKEKGQDDG